MTYGGYHPAERDFTFHSPRHNAYYRIDLFVSEKWLLQNVIDSRIHGIARSDYAPISIKLKNANSHQKSYIWRMNNYLLQQPENIKYISQKIDEFFCDNVGSVSDPTILWNAHKI